jgi:hypothetical protein
MCTDDDDDDDYLEYYSGKVSYVKYINSTNKV